jgi:cation transport ATPase
MLHLTLFIPLVISGTVTALWREYRQKKIYQKNLPALVIDNTDISTQEIPIQHALKPFDDMSELNHYQSVSWYALAFSTAGLWFYPPITLLALPLVGYNSYHFIKVLQNSDRDDRTSALTLFETIGVGGTLLTGHIAMGTIVLASSFSIRKLFLQGHQVIEIRPRHIFNMEQASVCVMREGVEVEIYLSELQKGDIFILHTGDIVLAEGKVLEGEALVDQYSLQRKMKTIHKEVGDWVFSFTQIKEGSLHIIKT